MGPKFTGTQSLVGQQASSVSPNCWRSMFFARNHNTFSSRCSEQGSEHVSFVFPDKVAQRFSQSDIAFYKICSKRTLRGLATFA